MLELTQPGQRTDLRCWVIGHRGAAAICPENTLDSFLTARDAGACMIELDVQQSADDELIVFHDETLDRLCGEATDVGSLTGKALTARTVGQWYSQPVTIPTLAQVFTTLRDSLLYNVELKTDVIYYPGIEARLAALVVAHGLAERVLVSSFNHESLRLVKRYGPNLTLGLLLDARQAQQCTSPEGVVARALEFSCFSIHPEFTILRRWPELGIACHAVGLRVFPWTVDDPNDWRFLVNKVNVDGIITNDPRRLHHWLLELKNSDEQNR